MKDVSIIIVNWNTEKLLVDAVESLKSETSESSFEIIIVDNNSTDNSVGIVRKKFPEVIIIENKTNAGFAKANNQGIEKSTGRYICLINTDTLATDHVIDKMIRYMDSNKDVGVLLPLLLDSQMKRRHTLFEFPNLRNILCEALYLYRIFPGVRIFRSRSFPVSEYTYTREVDSVPCNYMMVRKEALLEVGKLDEQFFIYAEDIDWSKRFHDKGWKIVHYPEARAIHFGGASSSVAPAKFLIENIASDIQYWKKHHGVIKCWIYRCILVIHYLIRISIYGLLLILVLFTSHNTAAKLRSYIPVLMFLVTNKGRRWHSS